MQNPVITIEMMNGDVIKAELYPEIAPNTVNNFLSLVKNGFYDGLIFHRVIRGFMIQGGCPNGNGMGGPGYSIKGEFSSNGFPNTLAHTEGVLSFLSCIRLLPIWMVSMQPSERSSRVWMWWIRSRKPGQITAIAR